MKMVKVLCISSNVTILNYGMLEAYVTFMKDEVEN